MSKLLFVHIRALLRMDRFLVIACAIFSGLLSLKHFSHISSISNIVLPLLSNTFAYHFFMVLSIFDFLFFKIMTF